jgi:hypothetical protein
MTGEPTGGTKDWPPDRRAALALSLFRGEVSTEEAAHRYGLTQDEIEGTKAAFLRTAEEALAIGGGDDEAPLPEADVKGGRDMGVWVCSLEPQSLTPCLFIQSVCSDRFPLETSAPWHGDSPPPRAFRNSRAISPLHGECERTTGGNNRWHLFSAKVADGVAIERETVLSEWGLPVRVGGVVVLLERGDLGDRPPILGRASRLSADRTLAWVLKQQLPFVVAVMGYRDGHIPEGSIRELDGLSPSVPLIPGPTLSRRPGPGDKTGGSDSGERQDSMSLRSAVLSLVSGGNLRFDPAYARKILDTLDTIIEITTQ